MVGNLAVDSIHMSKYQYPLILFLITLLGSSACDNELGDVPLPFRDFQDIVINLDLPENRALNNDKGFIYRDDAGVRGLIIYHESGDNYYVYERNCSYEPNGACATVEVHSSGLYMVDNCCGSIFSFPNAFPTREPARSALRIYESSLQGRALTITDNSANDR